VLGRQALHPVPQAIFTLQDDLNVNSLQASSASIRRVHVTEDGTSDALRIGTGGGPAAPYQLRLGANAIRAVDGRLGGAFPSTLYLDPDGGGVEFGNGAVNFNGDLRFRGGEPFAGIELRFFSNDSAWDEFEDSTLLVPHNNGRSVCFLQKMAISNGVRATEEICELVRSGDGNYHLISRGRADRAVRCAAACMLW